MTSHRTMATKRHTSRHSPELSRELSIELVHSVRNLAMVAVYALETMAQQTPASARTKHELVERSILDMVELVENTLVPRNTDDVADAKNGVRVQELRKQKLIVWSPPLLSREGSRSSSIS
jgi:Cft2 family RNA processing exonuclease